MEQKKNQKDVLIVRDEKTGEIGVVAGLKSDGTPKMTPATEGNKANFLLFDKNSNMLDSFLDNFFRQCKEPKRFGFYRVAAESVEQVIEVFKEMLKDPEANKDLLAPHRVDTEKYNQQVETEQAGQTASPEVAPQDGQQAQTVSEEIKPVPSESNDLDPFWQAVEDHWFPDEKEPGKQEQTQKQEDEQEQTQDGQSAQEKPDDKKHVIDESRIDWTDMKEVYGIDRAALEASGDLQKMLNYGKSELVTVAPHFNGERYEIEARLSFKEMPDGSIGIVPHTIRKEPKLDEEFMGYSFSVEDKENLKKSGNMGRVAELVDKETGEITPAYISIDRQTNEITAIPVKDVPVPTGIGQTKFTEHEMNELRAGRALLNKEIVLSEKRKFTAILQVNVERRGVEFVPKPKQNVQNRKQQNGQNKGEQNVQRAQQPFPPKPATKPEQAGQTTQTTPTDGEQKPKVYKFQWLDENGKIRAPKALGGVELTPEQQKDFMQQKAIYVKDMLRDGKGEPYTAYVKYNFEAGKPKYYRTNPDVAQKQEVAPTAEHRTQVAVNTDGKTNEATNRVREPLRQGQTQPTEQQNREQRQQPNKPKGIRM